MLRTCVVALAAVPVAVGLAAAQNVVPIELQPKQPILQPAVQPRLGFAYDTRINLVQQKDVQEDIKATPEQIAKFQEIVKAQAEAFQGLKDVQGAERFDKMKEIYAKTSKDLEAALKPEQVKRLEQIRVQVLLRSSPLAATMDEKIKDRLKLTADQQAQLTEQMREMSQEIRNLFQGGNREEAMKKMTELRKKTYEKFEQLLTDEQKKALKDMTGEPFKGADAGNPPRLLPVQPGVQIRPIQPNAIPNAVPKQLPVEPAEKRLQPGDGEKQPAPAPKVEPVNPIQIQVRPIQIQPGQIQPVPLRPNQVVPLRRAKVEIGLGGETAPMIRRIQIQPGQIQPVPLRPNQVVPLRRAKVEIGLGGETAPMIRRIQIQPGQIQPVPLRPNQVVPLRRAKVEIGLGGETAPMIRRIQIQPRQILPLPEKE